jgi:hypothetical protein
MISLLTAREKVGLFVNIRTVILFDSASFAGII